MYDQPRYDPMEESDFGPFDDGRSARNLVEGTVARGELRTDDHFYTGKVNGEFVTQFPAPVSQHMLERGRERYNIYCSVCHGYDGRGQGMAVRRGFKQPPSFHEQRMRDATLGHYFDVITHGFGVMPSYAAQTSEPDRWAIVAYVRALQLSQNASLDALTPEEVSKLEAMP